ncbi:MAG: hypothetical protein LBN32_04450 [Helicobacteraceae bacterium]|jgi:hypothetical protein|nr:hypothetical protein [Helicobacteraceae bacterium]
MQNYKTPYNQDFPINGTTNAWEYYFKQPLDYTLDEVYNSQNVIVGSGQYFYANVPYSEVTFWKNERNISKLANVISENIRFNDTTMNYCKEQYNAIIGDKSNVLCVSARSPKYGTSMLGHPLQPTSDELFTKVKEYFERWNMEWIFLSTDCADYINMFKEHFKDKILHIDFSKKMFFDINTYAYINDIGESRQPREVSTYQNTISYISQIWIASKCDSIVCSIANGSAAALEFNNNRYKHKYIFDFGTVDRPKPRNLS